MDILYKGDKVAKICDNQKEATKKLGSKRAERLQKVLFELHYASSLEEFRRVRPSRRCHELKADRKGQFAVDLDEQFRIVFYPSPETPLKEDGGADWARITEITIAFIGDYHD